nr:phage major capsid protein [uncultured Rhodopila sp.]
MTERVADLRRQRAAAFDTFKLLAEKPTLTAEEQIDYTSREKAVREFDGQITRALAAQELSAATAVPVAGQEPQARTYANPESDPYINDAAARRVSEGNGSRIGSARSLVFGGMLKMAAAGNGNLFLARQSSREVYGENHPVTRALITSVGSSGGFIVPPDYMNEIIELLRPASVVRSSNPRVIPMPRGTMTLPSQTSPATATYGTEVGQIAASQQTVGQIIASFKKLTALVPVSNDMMRYADPAVDAFVRDDLVKVVALREDLAFIFGDGTQSTPRGWISFANMWVASQGGTIGTWLNAANSTAAVNGASTAATNPLTGQNGGNFITSDETYTLSTVSSELGGAINKLDTANVAESRRIWFMHPRTFNYLYWVQNSLGVFVFRDELDKGKLSGYPIKKSTQIPINIWDATGTNKDCSFIFLAEMDETMILDSMSLELAVSREGSYVDASGNTVSAFQNDQTLVRAIAEHDFQMRHDSAVAVIQFVRWAPTLS